ncbi:hypothetical protein pb186bvf_001406 [Paramecium bursaria]
MNRPIQVPFRQQVRMINSTGIKRVLSPQIVRQLPNDQHTPLQVVDLFQVEEPWRQKVAQLEEQLRRVKQSGTPISQDEDKEIEISAAYSQIQQLLNTVKNLQEDIQQQQRIIDQKNSAIEKQKQLLNEKDKEIDDANQYTQQLLQQLEEQSSKTENNNKYLHEEVQVWKKKFLDQNKELHEKQEELLQAYQEVDSLKNQLIAKKNSDYKGLK